MFSRALDAGTGVTGVLGHALRRAADKRRSKTGLPFEECLQAWGEGPVVACRKHVPFLSDSFASLCRSGLDTQKDE